jgi:hypothetical protein
MYPRNAASPPRIAIGAVVQISDGVVQTSGVSVAVRVEGGSETAGGGTVSYGSLSGIVYYTPTQAETDYTAFVVVAYKSGCIPIEKTVATSASATAGYSGVDWGKIADKTATVALTNTTINAAPIADAVWDEAYSQHTTAGTFGKLMDVLRKSNTVLEGTILASPTPTTTVFKVSGIDYPTGALEHAILWMASGTSQNQNSPILTTLNNGDGTVTVTLEEALVTAPVAGDTVLIDPTSHVHAIADIQGVMPDRLGYLLAVLAGAISDAGTAAETYTITLGASTFTVDYSGLDASGNRTGATLTKT